jgi:spermidine/putrescine transport system permease protein
MCWWIEMLAKTQGFPRASFARISPQMRLTAMWLLPPAAWFVVFLLVPYLITAYYSLGHMQSYRYVAGFSLSNYARIFTTAPYSGAIAQSAEIGLLTALFSSLVAYPVAMVMAFRVTGAAARSAMYLLVILPWWASYLVKAYAWKTILGPHGILNSLLLSMHVVESPITILLYNKASVVLTLTYIFTPFAILSIYASLERIPASLLEAAEDLGAGGAEIFWRIILPLSVPGLLAGAVITFALGFGDFVAPALLGGADTLMISTIMINLLGVANDRPLASAIGIIIVILAFLLIGVMGWAERRVTVRI